MKKPNKNTNQDQPKRGKLEMLTGREFQVGVCVWAESSDKLIADGLHISIGTVRKHIAAIKRKFNTHTRVGIAVQFEREGSRNTQSEK